MPEKDNVDVKVHTGGETAARADIYKNNARVRVAQMAGRELMFADSKLDEWVWEEKLGDEEFFKNIIGKLWLIVGKTETGKSFFIREMMYRMRKLFPFGIIISHTKHNAFYQQFFPNHLIINRFNAQVVRDIINAQMARHGDPGRNTHFLLLMDDIASEKLQHIQILQELAMEGRHYGITTIFTTQHFTKAITQIRTNARWNVLFTTTNENVMDQISTELATDHASREDFDAWYDMNTKDHRCIIVDQNPNKRGSEKYYTFKALSEEECPQFVMLCDKAWGGNRFDMCRKQRRKFRPAKKYAKSYLEKLFVNENLYKEEVAGNTDRYRKNTEVDFRKILT